MRAQLVVAVGVVALTGVVGGCRDEPERAAAPVRTLPSRRAVAVHPDVPTAPEAAERARPPAKVDLSFGDGFEMRHPIQDGRLTLIPILATGTPPAQKFITLQDGMTRHVVSVREISDEWEVDTVRITNRAREPLVALSGELIVDANQDRVLAEDTVVAPGKTELVHVRCVEQERDHGGTTFHAGHAIGELSLRRRVVHDTQDAVWAQVDVINTRNGLSPDSKTYRGSAQLQSLGAARARRDRLVAQLQGLEERSRMVGLAIAVDGQVLAIDRLATPALYQQLETELVGSYLPDTDGPPVEGKKVSPDEVRALAASAPSEPTTASSIVLRPL
jgi:hypothetical protein